MPVGTKPPRRFNFQIADKGYMLVRQQGVQSWRRTGRPNIPVSAQGQQPGSGSGVGPELDIVSEWRDWSAGFGHAYRELPNGYHWSENFDARFPRQLVHAQALRLAPGDPTFSTDIIGIDFLLDSPFNPGVTGTVDYPSVVAHGAGAGGIGGGIFAIVPESPASVNVRFINGAGDPPNITTGRSALFGSFIYISQPRYDIDPTYSGYPSRLLRLERTTNLTTYSLNTVSLVVAGNQLWRARGNNSPIANHNATKSACFLQNLAAGATPQTQANWSATIPIGDGYSNIKDMEAYDDQLYCGFDNGLYAGDSTGTFKNVLSELSYQKHQDNCRDITIHNGEVVVQTIGGMWAYQPRTSVMGAAREIGFNRLSNRSPVRGWFRAVRSFGQWLYGGYHTGSISYLMAGHDTQYGFQWHTLNRLPHVAKIHRIHFDGITTTSGNAIRVPNRIWIATDASIDTGGTAPLYWAPIPLANENPLGAPGPFSANYIGSARMDLGADDFGYSTIAKSFRSVEIESESLSSGNIWCQIFYEVDRNGSFALLGTSAKSPNDTLYFPASEGSFITGRSIELSIRSFTATAGITPVYRAIRHHATLQPRTVDIVEAVARIADGMLDNQRLPMRNAATQLQELRDFADPDVNGLQPHKLIDLSGATQWIKVLAPVEEQEIYQQGSEYPEIAATIRMAVLDFS